MTGQLQETLMELEQHVAQAGWDQRPQLFALAGLAEFRAQEPALAAQLGLDGAAAPTDGLVPILQDALPDGPLDESLSQIGWSAEVRGCALVQEVMLLPPAAEQGMPDQPDQLDVLSWVAEHPERREARLVVAVLRDGSRACAVRLRGASEEELLLGDDLAPNLAEALLATLE
ncbi:MAG TPA: PPA1309 family protein [Mycobacteriales bacterium]|nr:PPA1309 family protein [Mycobacteriales bacterium]